MATTTTISTLRIVFAFGVSFCVLLGAHADEQDIKPPTKLIRGHGYPAVGQNVVTEDGYLLRLDRIPQPGRPAVLLTAPFLSDSATYCFLGKGSLAFMLYDAGYDVWLGNFRGSGMSNHTSLSPSDHRYWNYTLHEHGTLDLPALVDAVLFETRLDSLLYVSHSLGSTALLIAGSERPDLAKRVQAAFLMGPVAHLAHHQSPAITIWHAIEPALVWFEQTFGPTPLPLVGFGFTRQYSGLSCHRSIPIDKPNYHCLFFRIFNSFFFGAGDVIYPAYFEEYMPSTAGLMDVIHYAQHASRPGFRQFDYGVEKNRAVYGQDTPPEYDLASIQIPIHLYTGPTDPLVMPEDLNALTSSLRNLRGVYEVPLDNFGHVDFVLNPASPDKLYSVLISDIGAVVRNVANRDLH